MNDISNQQQQLNGKKKHIKKGSIDGGVAIDKIGSLLLDEED